MRKLHAALWAVAGAAGLLAGAVVPVAAGPMAPVDGPVATGTRSATASVATSTQTVTLITGDTVTLTAGADGRFGVDVRHGKGREAVTFLSSEKSGEVSVVPSDAIPLLQAGRLDPALFNVTQLVKQGYGDAKTGTTPVIATYRKGSETPRAHAARSRCPGSTAPRSPRGSRPRSGRTSPRPPAPNPPRRPRGNWATASTRSGSTPG
ncbi:hypothetical protein SVIO_027560 [Streptomyces violaceusniger]|uniref:Uncharacterized protein n=1 Tax=Streptomyces violaceusniger TaxID=68280 RepID=A0A4D4L2A7_STRVO|nr:hypothetical protein SVIO_027560 [Streptomyces violaceusniger]